MIELPPFEPHKLRRNDDPETSDQAARRLAQRTTQMKCIVERLAVGPATWEELVDHAMIRLDKRPEERTLLRPSIRRRLHELVNKKVAQRTDEKRKSVESNRDQCCYALAPAEEEA